MNCQGCCDSIRLVSHQESGHEQLALQEVAEDFRVEQALAQAFLALKPWESSLSHHLEDSAMLVQMRVCLASRPLAVEREQDHRARLLQDTLVPIAEKSFVRMVPSLAVYVSRERTHP